MTEVGLTPGSWTPRMQSEVLGRGLWAGVPQAEVLPWKQSSQLPALPGWLPRSLDRSSLVSQLEGLQRPEKKRPPLDHSDQATRAHVSVCRGWWMTSQEGSMAEWVS